jgi:amino acid permease
MFKGVFTPSILTILGVIMYLRFGWVVGHAGLVGAILVVLLAHVISVTTGLSISSIATNRTVRAGGDYYMISRSLGLPIGGAIGIVLFFALALSMSLYIIGFAESLHGALGVENTLLARRVTGTVTCVLLTALTAPRWRCGCSTWFWPPSACPSCRSSLALHPPATPPAP